jgi:hypothetical protein
MKRQYTTLLLLVLLALLPASARAHHISGTVYCDADADGVIDNPGDTPLASVGVKLTSLTVAPGTTWTTTTDASGFYNVNLPARTDDYRVELTGLPAGWTIVVPAGGTYTINIITQTPQQQAENVNFLIQGCAAQSTTTTSTTTVTTTTTTTLCVCSDVPFLTRGDGKIGNSGQVLGTLAANDPGSHLNIGKQVFMADGTAVIADSVRVGEQSSVFRALGNTLQISQSATVRDGTGPATLPVVQPFCALGPPACGGPDVRVNTFEKSGPLAPGSYGIVRIQNTGMLALAAGTFDFCQLQMGRGSVLSTEGAVTINVQNIVRVGNNTSVLPVPPAPPVVLNVAGKLIRFGQAAHVQAAITAPNAQMSLGRSSVFLGTFCVDSLRDDKSITLGCPCP